MIYNMETNQIVCKKNCMRLLWKEKKDDITRLFY